MAEETPRDADGEYEVMALTTPRSYHIENLASRPRRRREKTLGAQRRNGGAQRRRVARLSSGSDSPRASPSRATRAAAAALAGSHCSSRDAYMQRLEAAGNRRGDARARARRARARLEAAARGWRGGAGAVRPQM